MNMNMNMNFNTHMQLNEHQKWLQQFYHLYVNCYQMIKSPAALRRFLPNNRCCVCDQPSLYVSGSPCGWECASSVKLPTGLLDD